jgi:hypothetical protein
VVLHGAALTEGRLWAKPLEAVLGADVASRLRPRLRPPLRTTLL